MKTLVILDYNSGNVYLHCFSDTDLIHPDRKEPDMDWYLSTFVDTFRVKDINYMVVDYLNIQEI